MHSAGRKTWKIHEFSVCISVPWDLNVERALRKPAPVCSARSVLDTAVVDSPLSFACISGIVRFLFQPPNSSPILQFCATKWASNNAVQF